MFEIAPGAEEELVRDTARRFAEAELAPRIRDHEKARGVPRELRARYRDLGFDVLDVPPAAGGQGLGAFAKALVLEELGAADAGAALALERHGGAIHPLAVLGWTTLLAEISGPRDERAVVVDDVEARLSIDGGRVSGVRPWVPADEAAVVIVLQGDRAVAVREGFRLRPIAACGLDAAGAAELAFDGARIVERAEDPAALARIRARLRTYVAALLVGAARGAQAYSMGYATERTTFGRPIAHHQALAFLIADMATAVAAARVAVWRAAAAIEAGESAEWEAATALAEAAEQALFVGPAAVQLLGGHGFMKDHPVEKWMRDIRTLAQLGGGRDEAELAAAGLAPAHDAGLRLEGGS